MECEPRDDFELHTVKKPAERVQPEQVAKVFHENSEASWFAWTTLCGQKKNSRVPTTLEVSRHVEIRHTTSERIGTFTFFLQTYSTIIETHASTRAKFHPRQLLILSDDRLREPCT